MNPDSQVDGPSVRRCEQSAKLGDWCEPDKVVVQASKFPTKGLQKTTHPSDW